MVGISDGVKGAFRIGQTLSVVGRTSLGWIRGHRPPTPRLLRETFESLGATYIKLGQFIASSPTFFPKEYVEEFQGCLDRTPSLPFPVIRRIIREELGRPLEEVFSEIDPVALASASIAQVHAARLLSGEEVVIKVQKPGVETVLLTDLNLLYFGSRVVETLAPKLS
ncbi:AarF/UbiB family protein, partial [uncultured Marinobacter sp.]|uniref:AarF/UbiB family protein n=1 Tax=uncultured Marinobacter sp. TaxID=187379 RepID=UPI0030D84522